MNTDRDRTCPLNGQAIGWALHALEPDEEMVVREHLPQCPSCRAVATETEMLLAGLGASVEQVEPPPSLRESLLAQATQTPQVPPILAPRTSPEDTAPSTRHRPPPSPDTVRPAGRAWLSRRGRRLVGASLALLGVLTVGGLTARTVQLAEQRDAQTVQAQTLADIVTQLDEPGTTHATLAASGGPALAAVLVHDGRRTLVTAGLTPNAVETDTYVVWGTGNGAPRPIATFDVVSTDPDVRPVGSAAENDGFSGYAISLEPGRAAPAAPTTVVASGQVES